MTIRTETGDVVLTYRAFGGITGIIATFTAALVLLTGGAAALFLLLQLRFLTAAGALLLGVAFAVLINSLVPPLQVRLIDPSGRIVAVLDRLGRGLRLAAPWIISAGNGETLGRAVPRLLAPFLGERWRVDLANGSTAHAFDASALRALVRKALASFDRSFETDLRIELGREQQGWIRRRTTDGSGGRLELAPTAAIDPRVAIGLAAIAMCGEL